mmetsp:Transcript_48326/g.126367  ORF Transcript_48326/g.126367 Transcript_48326/m.126367 type:complete len:321 (-) Transcript_48326:331-1293(-)
MRQPWPLVDGRLVDLADGSERRGERAHGSRRDCRVGGSRRRRRSQGAGAVVRKEGQSEARVAGRAAVGAAMGAAIGAAMGGAIGGAVEWAALDKERAAASEAGGRRRGRTPPGDRPAGAIRERLGRGGPHGGRTLERGGRMRGFWRDGRRHSLDEEVGAVAVGVEETDVEACHALHLEHAKEARREVVRAAVVRDEPLHGAHLGLARAEGAVDGFVVGRALTRGGVEEGRVLRAGDRRRGHPRKVRRARVEHVRRHLVKRGVADENSALNPLLAETGMSLALGVVDRIRLLVPRLEDCELAPILVSDEVGASQAVIHEFG